MGVGLEGAGRREDFGHHFGSKYMVTKVMHSLTPNYACVDPRFCGFGTIEFCLSFHDNGIYTRYRGACNPNFRYLEDLGKY